MWGLGGCRTELAAGKYSVVVLGYALETQYQLTVDLVETQRALRPAATLALGQVRRVPSAAWAAFPPQLAPPIVLHFARPAPVGWV